MLAFDIFKCEKEFCFVQMFSQKIKTGFIWNSNYVFEWIPRSKFDFNERPPRPELDYCRKTRYFVTFKTVYIHYNEALASTSHFFVSTLLTLLNHEFLYLCLLSPVRSQRPSARSTRNKTKTRGRSSFYSPFGLLIDVTQHWMNSGSRHPRN